MFMAGVKRILCTEFNFDLYTKCKQNMCKCFDLHKVPYYGSF